MLVLGLVHHLLAQLAVVGVGGLLVVLVCLTHHEDVIPSPEWVWVHLDRVQVGVGVRPLRLVGGATIVVPDGKF